MLAQADCARAAHTDEIHEFGRLCGSEEAKAKLARTAAKMKARDQKRKERLKEQAKAEKERKKNVETAANQNDKTTKAEASAPSDHVTADLVFANKTPAEVSNLPEPRFMELEHELEPGLPLPPPPVSRRRSRQVCGACTCLYFFALLSGPQMMSKGTHVVSCLQPAMTGEEASDRPAAGQSVHIKHLLLFSPCSSPLALLPSRSLKKPSRIRSTRTVLI